MAARKFLSLENVGIRFQRAVDVKGERYFEPLKAVSLEVYAGETLGILGVNGAGKSTLLKVMSGALRPDSGYVENHGATVSLLALQAGFDKNLSGRDNAIFGGMLLGYTRRQAADQLDAIKAYSELGDYFHEPVRKYSSGMAARLGFAISTIMCPDVMLVDEVLSVGDAHFRAKAERTMMQKIAAGQTVVLVSHSRSQVAKLCDRCVILREGELIMGSSVEDVLSKYDDLIKSSSN